MLLCSPVATSQDKRRHNFQHLIRPELLFCASIETPPNWSMEPHKHDYCEMLYISAGSGTVYIEDKVYPARPGELFIYNSGKTHHERVSSENPFVCKVISLSDFYLEGPANTFHLDGKSVDRLSLGTRAPSFERLFERMLQELAAKRGPSYYLKIKTTLLEIISILVETYYETSLRPMVDPKREYVEEAKEFIEEYFTQSISLVDIANHTHTSTYYMSHIFKELIGDSPINYLIKLRIEKAKGLLRTTKLSVAEIGEMVGYSNVYHFSSIFKRHTGLSPRKFRESVSK